MSKTSNNKLVLGTVQMGLSYGINNKRGKISLNESLEILKHAFDNGIRVLDSAEVYGNAHEIIGLFHQKYPNLRFEIITKFPYNIDSNLIENKVVEYLDVLFVKSIDVLMFHSFESFQKNHQSIDLLVNLKLTGHINHIGVSVYTNEQLEYLLNEDLVTVVQLPFNMLDNIAVKGELLEKLKKKGKIIHTRSAFLQGLFFKNLNEKNIIVQSFSNELVILNQIKGDANCLMEELALGYCTIQENIDNVIIGVDSMEQLRSNLKASSYVVRKDLVKRINEIQVKDLSLLNPSLWK